MHKIHDQYTVQKDLSYMILLLLISVILVLFFGSTVPEFSGYGAIFFIIALISVWIVGIYVGKFGKKWKK